MPDVRLIQGDCLEALRALPDGSVDALVTDPPYFLPAQHYATRRKFARSLSDVAIIEHWLRGLFAACARVLKPTGTVYVFCDGQSYPAMYVSLYPHVKRQVPLVWDKIVSFNGYSWRHQHELILFGEMPDAAAVPTGDGDILRCRAVKVDAREHGAQKPVELLERIIKKSVPEGGTVLDPCLGSGTTGVACVNTGRNFIGIELDPGYFKIAQSRIAKAQEQSASALYPLAV